MAEEIKLTNPVNGAERRVFVQKAKRKPKAVMVIIHGFGEHAGRYLHMMEHMASKGISTLALDLEGHGTETPRQGVCRSYDILHADVSLALSESAVRFPDIPQFVFGHSMGGGLVLNHGLTKAPDVKAYLVSAPLIRPVDNVSGPLRLVVKVLRKLAPKMTIGNDIDGSKVSSLPEEQAKYENDPLNHGKLGVGLAVDIIEGGEWVAANADRWEAPLLLFHARGDQLTRFDATEAFASKARNCQFIPLENCEHEMHNDVTRKDVYQAMTDFILERV